MSLKRNLVANYLGQGWSAVMSLAFIPVYVRYLGMESYGLVGLFAVMQGWLVLLDIGMTPTLGREMARFTAGAHTAQSIRDLLRTLEILCFGLAALICVAVWAASGWLATDWLEVRHLPAVAVANAIAVMAFVLALRFVEGIYRSALIGLQKQVLYNAINALMATLRNIGVIAVLVWVRPTIEAFFMWQALVSMLSIIVLRAALYSRLPTSPARALFSVRSLTNVGRFARGMAGITALAVLLTQLDKLLVSRLLPLEIFGTYALATAVTGALYLLVTPITTALYPRLVEFVSKGDTGALNAAYHQGAQMVTVATAPSALLLAFFASGVVFAWSGDPALAEGVGPILSIMALGTFLNSLMYIPYHLQLAHGWTSLAARTNLVAVLIVIPTLLLAVPRYGAIGAACVWLALNLGYLLIQLPCMHRRILRSEARRWYMTDVAAPLAAAAIAMGVADALAPKELQDRWHWVIFLAMSLSLAQGAAIIAAPGIRPRVAVQARLFVRRIVLAMRLGGKP